MTFEVIIMKLIMMMMIIKVQMMMVKIRRQTSSTTLLCLAPTFECRTLLQEKVINHIVHHHNHPNILESKDQVPVNFNYQISSSGEQSVGDSLLADAVVFSNRNDSHRPCKGRQVSCSSYQSLNYLILNITAIMTFLILAMLPQGGSAAPGKVGELAA